MRLKMSKIELRNVKGTTDYSPKEQYIRNYISDTLKKVFEKYGKMMYTTSTYAYIKLILGRIGWYKNGIITGMAGDCLQ